MKVFKYLSFVAVAILIVSCGREYSSSTGWEYNNPNNGGFQKFPFLDQETGPGLVLVEGGTFTMGRSEQDVMFDNNNRPARVTVSSFYMDQTEVTNFHWLEYLYWIQRVYGETYPMVYKNALPDTLCWRSPLGFNEKYVDYYFRHPAYRDYPVVGVSWLQVNDFCKWRTDRVNEYILIREGIMQPNLNQKDETVFDTEAYLSGQYGAEEGKDGTVRNLQDLNPSHAQGKALGKRIVRMEDGMLLPRYRLPTEAEWEFASYGLIGNLDPNSEVIRERKLYPWNGHWVRMDEGKAVGDIRANFVRGRGDYMGVAGHLNDGADVTAPVTAYWPNDYGLYNMAGNVSEWVLDVYRPLSSEDFDEFRPFRGSVFKTKQLNNAGDVADKIGMVLYDVYGLKEYVNEFERIRYQRVSAQKHDITDTLLPVGVKMQVQSRNKYKEGDAPDPIYTSRKVKYSKNAAGIDSTDTTKKENLVDPAKDQVELTLLSKINILLDSAVSLQNQRYDYEASQLVQEEIVNGLFADELREGTDYEYDYEIITVLRQGFSSFIINTPGKLKYRNVVEEENIGRLNYRKSDYIDYLDGDLESSIYYNDDVTKKQISDGQRDPNLIMYQNEFESYYLDGTPFKGEAGSASWPTTLISDKSRVYKGGSWKDRSYWIVGSNRRYLDEAQSTSTIGFRCAMDRVGSPTGMNYYGKKSKK
jgi:gliding motility-associated lipoprotein GldJ